MFALYQLYSPIVGRGKPLLFVQSIFFLFALSTAASHAEPIDIIADPQTPNSISNALAKAPQDNSPWTIFLPKGDYYEKITITRSHVTLIGEGNASRLYFDAYAGQPMPEGSGNWGTSGSATLTIRATDFTARQLTIENSFDYPSNDRLDKDDPNKIKGSQAVAVKLDLGSDRALFDAVSIIGFQDTLFVDAGRSLFINSDIKGHVDFIFGAGTALFINNTIETQARFSPVDPIGYITAPSTSISTEYGLIFINNRFVAANGVAENSMALGRPWHPTRQFEDGRYADPNAIGQSVFIANQLDNHIKLTPWYTMGGTLKDGTRYLFQPRDARFFEYQNCGLGAVQHSTRRQLSATQAAHFTPELVLADWHPNYGDIVHVCP